MCFQVPDPPLQGRDVHPDIGLGRSRISPMNSSNLVRLADEGLQFPRLETS